MIRNNSTFNSFKKKMKIILLVVILILVFVLGCEKQTKSMEECITDSDCVIGGCSGTVCQSKNTEPIFTTCEFLPEYTCYKQINCRCIENRCQWEKTEEFKECLSESRETLNK